MDHIVKSNAGPVIIEFYIDDFDGWPIVPPETAKIVDSRIVYRRKEDARGYTGENYIVIQHLLGV